MSPVRYSAIRQIVIATCWIRTVVSHKQKVASLLQTFSFLKFVNKNALSILIQQVICLLLTSLSLPVHICLIFVRLFPLCYHKIYISVIGNRQLQDRHLKITSSVEGAYAHSHLVSVCPQLCYLHLYFAMPVMMKSDKEGF